MSNDVNKFQANLEQEIVLIVTTPLSTFTGEFASKTMHLSGLFTGPSVTQNFHDIYFDTDSLQLKDINVALRIRTEGSLSYLGLKGNDKWSKAGVSRVEVEELWSSNGLATILHHIDFMGINLKHPGVPITSANPIEIKALTVMQVIQERSLHRTQWPILDNLDTKVVIGSIDTIDLKLEGRPVRYSQIELELTKNGSLEILEQVSSEFLRIYSGFLRAWRYSKLQTGFAIESIYSSGGTSNIISEQGEITAKGIDAVEQILQKSNLNL